MVTFGGGAVESSPVVLFIGGLLFWPVYLKLAHHFVAAGARWAPALLLLWCGQGFFQAGYRLAMLMSV